MSFLSALPLWQWILLGSVPVGIILLYFLKLKRTPVEVPSTYLWSKTIEDLHVNSLLQRLRSSLLLFLQLMFVLLAALALLRPGWRGTSEEGDRLIFLVDNSASMSANDVAPSRLAEAKRLVRDSIDSLADNDVAMVIAFSDRAEVVQGFTSDRKRLRDAVEGIEPTNRNTNIDEALRAAAGLANPGRTSQAADVADVQVADALPATIRIYSDGKFPNVPEFNLGNLEPQYVPIGEATAENLAILAFSAERNPEDPDQVQAFGRIGNFGPEPASATVSLIDGDQLLDASVVEIPPDEETAVSFELANTQTNSLRLSIDQNDQLQVDNAAHAALNPPREVGVLLVTPGNQPLEIGLTTEQVRRICRLETVDPSYLDTEEYEKRVAAGQDDLVIYDRCAPAEMPQANTWFIGSVPPQEWTAGEADSPVLLIDVNRAHPLMRYLELFSLRIVEGRPLTGPPGAAELLTADIGTVLAVAPRGGYQDLVLGFPIIEETDEGTSFNSDWPVQRSWPVLLYNILFYLGGAADTATGQTIRPGETVELRTENRASELTITMPDGETRTLQTGPSGTTPFSDTDAVGLYEVKFGERLQQVFTVNLFSGQESDLVPAPEVEIGYTRVEGERAERESRSETWRWLLLVGLGLLATEWWVYTRRLAV